MHVNILEAIINQMVKTGPFPESLPLYRKDDGFCFVIRYISISHILKTL